MMAVSKAEHDRRLRKLLVEALSNPPVVDEDPVKRFWQCYGRGKHAPVEAAQTCAALMDHLRCTQVELARRLGVTNAVVCRLLQVARAPAEVQQALRERRISIADAAAHGRRAVPRRNPPPRVLELTSGLPHPLTRLRVWRGAEGRWEVVLRAAGESTLYDIFTAPFAEPLLKLIGQLRSALDGKPRPS